MEHNNRAWAEINLDAIENNIKSIRRHVSESAKILGVVKADAYGHGYLEVARTLLENGADALAVACLDEAIQLRRCYIHCPILILGHSGCEDAETLVFYDVMPACFDFSLASAMSAAAIRRRWFTALMLFCTVLICYSRIYLGKHFPMDLVWGTLVGAALGWAAYLAYRTLSCQKKELQ